MKLRWEPSLLRRRAFAARTLEEHRLRSGTAELPRTLGVWDMTFLGLGSIIGAGVFVLSGVAANQLAGPAVTLSYLAAAAAALLAALCYAEMAVSLPIAGGAFNYIATTFGELAAWTVAWNMILEITLSSAAVARGFASYVATLFGLDPSALRIQLGPVALDPAAAALVLALTALLAGGTAVSSRFNMVVSGLNIASIVFVLCAGLPRARAANLSPFAPYGADGVFAGASVVFFAFVGFDYVANAAEEAKDPARDLPWGIVGSLGIATVLYVLMALAITLMVPYNQIDLHAPFSAAFLDHGMVWAAKIVSLGAVLGIVTSTMTGLLGQSRLFVVLGRERLLPQRLAAVSPRTGTPIPATLLTGCLAAALALVMDIGVLAELVSVGTLYVFILVCAGVLYMRYHQPGSGTSPVPILAALAVLLLLALGFTLSFALGAGWPACAAFLVLYAAAVAALHLLLPVAHVPERFRVPLFPATPAAGVLLTVHLFGSLGVPAYIRFGAWVAAGLAIYALFGVHGAEAAERQHLRELGERRSMAANGSHLAAASPRLTTLDHEAPIGSIELQAAAPYGPVAPPSGWGDRVRLMAGHASSSAAYDPGED